LRGSKAAVTETHVDRILSTSLRWLQGHGEAPYPYGLFFFTMDDNQGYFTWAAEPVVSDGLSKLIYHEKSRCVKLDQPALDRIVDQVNECYDAFDKMVKF
jgi:hypothetical protein